MGQGQVGLIRGTTMLTSPYLFINAIKMSNKVYVDDGFLVIDVLKQPYEIPLGGIDTPDKLIRHVYNLSSKTWVTNEIIYQVIKSAVSKSDKIKLG